MIAPRSRHALSSWLFLRALGVVYLLAFWSLGPQLRGLVGEGGILPARLTMAGARAFVAAEHIGIDRFRVLPTVFWLGTGDTFLMATCFIGIALALLLIVGIAPCQCSCSWFRNFAIRLLQGSPDVLRLLERNPFPERPPRYVRAMSYRYQFTDAATRRATGAWWTRESLGPFAPPLSLEALGREHAHGS